MIQIKKGQFFIIGAVIVIITLFTIYDILSGEWNLDLSQTQGNNLLWVEREMENTILKVKDEGVTSTQLNMLIVKQREVYSKQGYDISVTYSNWGGPSCTATIKILAEDGYVNKKIDCS